MSTTPTINRTRVLVKDLIFQEKYRLSDKQTDVMSYVYNALSWALNLNGFMPLTNKKFAQDLPHIGLSSLEKHLQELKKMELIEVEMIKVPQWKSATVRGIKITAKGMEYNNHFFKLDESKVIKTLREELEIERLKNQELEERLNSSSQIPKNSTPETITPPIESKIETSKPQKQEEFLNIEKLKNELKSELKIDIMESIKEIFTKKNNPPKEEEPKKDIVEEVGEIDEEKEKKKAEIDIELIVNEPKDREMQVEDVINRDDLDELNRRLEVDSIKKEGSKYKNYDFPTFIEAVTRDFGLTSAPICNYVSNGKWHKATTFYINSYKRLSVTPPEGENRQLEEPEYINNFWKWLYKNQHRVGDVIRLDTNPTVQTLNIRYKNASLKADGVLYKFHEVVQVDKRFVKINMVKDGKIYSLQDIQYNREAYNTYRADTLLFEHLV